MFLNHKGTITKLSTVTLQAWKTRL